jgi:uncharacterized protein (TIGR00106 family)
MHVTAELCLVPLGVGVSVSAYVSACVREIRAAGFTPEVHAYGTNFEGDWDAVMAVLRRCHEVVHEMGAPRIHSSVKLGTRTDRDQRLADKAASIQSA